MCHQSSKQEFTAINSKVKRKKNRGLLKGTLLKARSKGVKRKARSMSETSKVSILGIIVRVLSCLSLRAGSSLIRVTS
jgi:hypothetical protein